MAESHLLAAPLLTVLVLERLQHLMFLDDAHKLTTGVMHMIPPKCLHRVYVTHSGCSRLSLSHIAALNTLMNE